MAKYGKTAVEGPGDGVVAGRIDGLRDEMLAFLVELCRIDTVNPPGNRYEECVGFLEKKLRGMGLATRVLRVPRGEQLRLVPGSAGYPRPMVVGRWDVGAKRTLHFTGHYDVVPATSGWRTDPFEPVIKGKRIYGRGTVDMKGSDVAGIYAIEAMRKAGVTPPWNIEVSFTPDEETGGYAGLGWLVGSGHVKADAAVLCEGGSKERIGYAHRGVLWANVIVIGKSGHASNPKNGINALEKAVPLIEGFQKLAGEYAKRKTGFKVEKAKLRGPTLMMGGISGGGSKTNTIPDRFMFTIDRRLNPEDKVGAVKGEIMGVVRAAQKKDKELKVKVEYPLHVEPGWTDEREAICRVAAEAVRGVWRKRPVFRMSLGFNDMHFLTRAGVPTVGYGVAGGKAHADGEYMEIPSMLATAKVYAGIAMRMAGE
jgi:succinyl-diaminopimelate desuccinylase